ncbi:MAG TPA: AAA family ATPase [Verrucomicrobiae bacterium]|jgi:predicted kinase|nr:AAA family ATPase [Verrucomicrobiae bacterium]
MELVLFIGIPATGKARFYRERLFRTHVRVSFDMLKSKNREQLLVSACLNGETAFVVDHTNLTREERARYINPARTARFAVHGYFFQSNVSEALARNASREVSERISEFAIRGARGRLEMPSLNEGFNRLHFVRLDARDQFVVEPWKEDHSLAN